MILKWRKNLIKQMLLTAWSMLTLVLLFFVALLMNELIKQGNNPLALPEETESRGAVAEPAPQAPVGTKEVQIYFASDDGRFLVPEKRNLKLAARTQENCKAVLNALIMGPREALNPIVPPSVQVRAVYLLSPGELVIDLTQQLKTDEKRPMSASAEALMVYGIVNSLTQEVLRAPGDETVRSVRFLFEGAPFPDNFPEHLDLSGPFGPDPRWILVSRDTQQETL